MKVAVTCLAVRLMSVESIAPVTLSETLQIE